MASGVEANFRLNLRQQTSTKNRYVSVGSLLAGKIVALFFIVPIFIRGNKECVSQCFHIASISSEQYFFDNKEFDSL